MASASATLRRLVEMSSFATLQEKLELWLEDYAVNTCDQNSTRCMEIIELNSRLQAQLFRLLGLTSSDGGVYGGASVIKSRLLPWLSTQYFGGATLPTVTDVALDALSEAAAKERELQDTQDMYEQSLRDIETDLSLTKAEANELKFELAVKNDELETEIRRSTSDKMFTEAEVAELRSKVRQLEDELSLARSQATRADSYERQISRLRDELALLNSQRATYSNGDVVDAGVQRARSPSPSRLLSSIVGQDPPLQRYRQQKLISRFNEMYAADRLNAMDTLRQYTEVEDHENNQRVVFAAIQEAFRVTRLAFSSARIKIRSTLVLTHVGPETIEEAVQNYIDRHRSELYETADLVDDVVRALEHNPGLYLPAGVSFMVIHPFIRESCKLAWSMLALPRPLDIAPAASLELFDDSKYRMSYDSDLAAPLVTYHIWPCLIQGLRVMMKGEACAIRGAILSRSNSRSRSRSISPTRQRTVSPYRGSTLRTSRSPSPTRRKLTSSSSSGRFR